MRWFIYGGLAAGVLAVCVAFFGAFGYSSVCSRCGAVRQTTEWQIPCTSIPIFSRSSVRQTPVSLSMTTNRIAPPHGHQWVFAQGGGNGVRCALGSAHMVRFTVESSEVAQLLAALERYGERGFRDKVLTNLFDDSTTHLVRTLSVPSGGFTNAAQLHAWISEESEYFDEMVTAFRNR
jgi:hypothetical protein